MKKSKNTLCVWLLDFAHCKLKRLSRAQRKQLKTELAAFISHPMKPTGDPPPPLKRMQRQLLASLAKLGAGEPSLDPTVAIFRQWPLGQSRVHQLYGAKNVKDVEAIFLLKALDAIGKQRSKNLKRARRKK